MRAATLIKNDAITVLIKSLGLIETERFVMLMPQNYETKIRPLANVHSKEQLVKKIGCLVQIAVGGPESERSNRPLKGILIYYATTLPDKSQ
jgi:hypothetical protein